MPYPGPLHCSYIAVYIYNFCPLFDPDVGPSVFVCNIEHSFRFDGSKVDLFLLIVPPVYIRPKYPC